MNEKKEHGVEQGIQRSCRLNAATPCMQTVVSHFKNMRIFILTLLLSSVGLLGQAQPDSLNAENPAFKSILAGNSNIFAIDNEGKILVWDLKTLEKNFESADTIIHFTSIAKDRNNQIYLGTDKGQIFKFDTGNFSIDLYLNLKKEYPVSNIFFNSLNEIFLIVPYALYDPINNQFWEDFNHEPNGMIVQKRVLFFFRKRIRKYFDMPEYTFIDSSDRIWMAKSFGEFGGSLQLFDTRERKIVETNFDSLNFEFLFPRSVFEDNKKNIYITSGLQHFGNSGKIFKIENSSTFVIFDSEDFVDSTDTNPFGGGIFVGPGIYNEKEQKIYFATTDGFYKADVPTNGRMKLPELVFKPNLIWEREPLAIGIGMTIKKLEFIKDNRLVFLTSNNGIGVYDGEKLLMLK